MRLIGCFLITSLFLTFTSCDRNDVEDEIVKPKTYLDYPNFVREGLVAYYPLNGDSEDYSGNNLHGTLHGATPAPDRFNATTGAYSFDGEDDFIEINNSSHFNNNSGTVCLWVKLPHPPDPVDEKLNHRAILSKAGTAEGGFVIQKGYGQLLAIVSYPNGGRSGPTMGSPESLYVFIALSFTENTLKSYRDGKRIAWFSYKPDWLFNNNKHNVYIGKSPVDDKEFHNYKNFMGEIDDVLIYNRALTDDEIQQLANWKKKL